MSEIVSQQQLATKAQDLAHSQHKVIHLQGDLGTGKTTFCQYFIHELIADALVTSPTYPIIQQYSKQGSSETSIYHIDLYRMHHPHQVEELALHELLNDQSILLIEWPDKGSAFTPKADLIIELDYMDADHRLYSVRQPTVLSSYS